MDNRRLICTILTVVSLFSVYEIGSGIYYARKTGLVTINLSDPKADITVLQSDRKPADIGPGLTKVRLKPGAYQIIASVGINQKVETIQIYSAKSYSLNLAIATPSTKTETQKKVDSANVFVKLLPYTNTASGFKISYKYRFTNTAAVPVFTITAPTSKGQQDALGWIKSLGFNPTDFEINYALSPTK